MKNRRRDIIVITILSLIIAVFFCINHFSDFRSPLVDPKLTTKQYAAIDNIKRDQYQSRGKYRYHAFGAKMTYGAYALTNRDTYTSMFNRYLKEGMGGVPVKKMTQISKLSNRTSSQIVKSITNHDKIISIELENLGIEKKYGAKRTAEIISKTLEKVHKQHPNTIVLVLSAWGENKTTQKYNAAVEKETSKYRKTALYVDITKISHTDDVTGPSGLYTHFGISDDKYPNNFGMRLIAYEMFERLHQFTW
ncbi:hypothetical protein EFP00_07655 [Lactiplantibacillus paraplantarum]|uniref:hypothetical protein n=1 Tax=Lactiplantibacillus paraplantarum TaxID=60520 RepID=UPI0021A8FC8E|nr:hypothetical protein [Lactiplantibacillus paraplantarum]MCT4457304.1 hypothetical protein [Lactiplantibacillus paraplantarum]